MARRFVEVVEDDLTGSTADETVMFGLDGSTYEIDLTTDNAAALRELLAPYVAAARRKAAAGNVRRGKPAAEPRRSGASSTRIREWAHAQGMEIKERGRIPSHVVERYHAAHR